MSISCGFYNSVNGDRRYGSPQMSELFDGVINDGVFMHVGGALMTTAGSGMSVIVAPGRAWFDRTWTYNDADYPITIAPAEVILNRIDAIVLETNSSSEVRDNTIKVVKGTPASTAQKPALTNTGEVHQHPLAYVTVNAGVSSITGEDIEIVVGKTECPFVTAILETTDITALMNEWQSQFDKWFANVEYTLSGDVAGKLQTEINGCVKIADKASDEEAILGADDSKWMTPKATMSAVSSGISSMNRVGDVVISMSPELKPGFVLCNGSTVKGAELNDEKLAEFLNVAGLNGAYSPVSKNVSYSLVETSFSKYVEELGLWVYGARSTSYGMVFMTCPYSKDSEESIKTVYVPNNSSDATPTDMVHIGDTYYIFCLAQNRAEVQLVTTKDFSLFTSLSSVIGSPNYRYVYGIAEVANTACIFIGNADSPSNITELQVMVSATPSNPISWTKTTIVSGLATSIKSIGYQVLNNTVEVFYGKNNRLIRSVFNPATNSVSETIEYAGIPAFSVQCINISKKTDEVLIQLQESNGGPSQIGLISDYKKSTSTLNRLDSGFSVEDPTMFSITIGDRVGMYFMQDHAVGLKWLSTDKRLLQSKTIELGSSISAGSIYQQGPIAQKENQFRFFRRSSSPTSMFVVYELVTKVPALTGDGVFYSVKVYTEE